MARWVMADGGLAGLDPLTRPFRLAALRDAVAEQDTLELAAAGRRAFRWLADELDRAADSTAVVAEVGIAAYRNGRRDSFRQGGATGLTPAMGVWASLTRGPFVAVVNPAFDNRLKHDPEFTGKTDRVIAGRLQAGYLALTGGRGDLWLGRMPQQWGPELFDGLQLSPSAYATDMLSGTLRLGRFALTTVAQRLDDADPDSSAPGVRISRWFLAHRLTIRAGRGTWFALTETGVYGGPGRGFEPAFHMPLAPGLLAEYNERRPVNLFWGAEAHVRLSRRAAVEAHAMLDDIQIDNSTLMDKRPTSGGLSFVIRGALPVLPVHASLGYTRVAALTYRNGFAPWETYTSSRIGIGRNFSDYDQMLLRVEARPASRVAVTLDLSRIRQGSADIRQPYPADSVLALPGQGFLVAPVRAVTGARLALAAEPLEGLELNAEAGLNAQSGGGTVAIASLGARLRFDLLHRRVGGAWSALER